MGFYAVVKKSLCGGPGHIWCNGGLCVRGISGYLEAEGWFSWGGSAGGLKVNASDRQSVNRFIKKSCRSLRSVFGIAPPTFAL